ncbi:pilS cassette [Neisseria meningitidis]|nr:pilS cassette [Neisseria meningitidis]PKT85102.1 pilS cassette [Neisseria meningitidis]PKT86055.1 pilS cassette [Neisseria meningitidis]PKT91389.1 pilS cassette [Neisseria meningitidis]
MVCFHGNDGILNCRYLPGKTASPPPSFPRRRESRNEKPRCYRQ